MPINTKQLIELIIQPTLKDLDLYSLEAEILLAGTCAQESGMGTYLKQIEGPALGIWMMEPDTHDDLWENYIYLKPELHNKIGKLSISDRLFSNFSYACTMARIQYLRVKEPLPYPGITPTNISAFAAYWKKHYNTPNGGGTVQQFIDNFNRYVKPYYQEK